MTRSAKLLIVDDDPTLLSFLQKLATGLGHRVDTASRGDNALKKLERGPYDIVMTDVKLPGATGIDILREAKRTNDECQVVLMTAFATIDLAVEAMKHGASDFLQKPFAAELAEASLARVAERSEMRAEIEYLKRARKPPPIIGWDGGLAEVREAVDRIARSPASVVIYGESGSGKELIAREIHARSLRSAKRMVTLHVPAIPETLIESELFGHEKGAFTGATAKRTGLLELADGGSLFLDEIGDLAEAAQVKLLRFLQERTFRRLGGNDEIEVDVRIIAATHRNLRELSQTGRFREDLFFRLEVVPIHVPPLRDRKSDIPAIVDHFVEKFGKEMGSPIRTVSSEVMAIYGAYDWPGNVRELENVIARAIALTQGESLVRSFLDEQVAVPVNGGQLEELPLPEYVERIEKDAIVRALRLENGVKSRAARRLGIKRTTLVEKIARYGIQ